jgi:hypothetical protein
MTDDVAMSTAAKELGLTPGAMELAAQLGEVHTVRAASGQPPSVAADTARSAGRPPGAGRVAHRVPRAELSRLRAAEDFPAGLRARLRVVNGRGGAQQLGITTARFSRLARVGCFSPVRVYVNRYRTVVWLYLAADLRAFAGHRPELLSGRLPRGLRLLLGEGTDLRARHWRGRRLGQLCRQADGPWEAAAARAAVLSEEVLAEAVPDDGERARLSALRPELMPLASRPAAVREVARELCTAASEDEIFWQRLMLAADLEFARASERAPASTEEAPAEMTEVEVSGGRQEVRPAGDVRRPRPGRRTDWSHGARPERPAERRTFRGVGGASCDGAVARQERHSRVLAVPCAPRQAPGRQRPLSGRAYDPGPVEARGGRFSRPAF